MKRVSVMGGRQKTTLFSGIGGSEKEKQSKRKKK